MSQIDLGQVAASVTLGTVTEVPYGTAPSITNSGTVQNAIFNFSIPSAASEIVNHGTSDTTYLLPANELHIWGEVASLTITLALVADDSIVNEYMFQFTSGTTATTLSLPSGISWVGGSHTIEPNTTYQVSIINNIGVIGGA